MSEFEQATPEQEAELERLQAKGFAHPDGSSEISEKEAFGRRADEVENELRRGRSAINTGAVYMARWLLVYIEDRLWEGQHDSLADGLAQPGIEVSESHARNLANVYRSLVIERKVPPEALKGLDFRKLQCALPAIKAGEVSRDQALADARALTYKAMQDEYKRGRNEPIDPEDEPARVSCEACKGRGWITPDGGDAET